MQSGAAKVKAINSFRVFISSSNDVAIEREIARKTLQQFAHEFANRLKMESYFWDYEPMDFSEGYQAQIPRPSDFDVVSRILWRRLGRPLTINVTKYPSGTAYELIEAKNVKAASIQKGRTDFRIS